MPEGNSGDTTHSRARNLETTVKVAVSRYLTHKLESGGSRATIKPVLEDFTEFCSEERVTFVGDLDSSGLRE